MATLDDAYRHEDPRWLRKPPSACPYHVDRDGEAASACADCWRESLRLAHDAAVGLRAAIEVCAVRGTLTKEARRFLGQALDQNNERYGL